MALGMEPQCYRCALRSWNAKNSCTIITIIIIHFSSLKTLQNCAVLLPSCHLMLFIRHYPQKLIQTVGLRYDKMPIFLCAQKLTDSQQSTAFYQKKTLKTIQELKVENSMTRGNRKQVRVHQQSILASRDAFVRRVIHVSSSVRLSVCLGRLCIVIMRCTLARI